MAKPRDPYIKPVMRVDQSPMNGQRWCLSLMCGHEEWITRLGRPKIRGIRCSRCAASVPVDRGNAK